MKTSTILNPALAAASPPAAKQPDAAPDTSFNQVLSREMADRAPATAAARPAPNDNEAAKAPAPAAPAARTDKTAASEKPKSADAADPETDEEAIPATASAELLALVASLTQAGSPGAARAADAAPASRQSDESDALLGEGKGKGSQHASDTGLAALLNRRLASDAPVGDEPAPGAGTAADPAALGTDSAVIAASPDDFAAAMESAARLRAARPLDMTANAAPAAQPVAAQAPLENLQAAAAQASDRIAPKVGGQDWNQALGQKIVWMAAGTQQSASLTLNPPDLGPLHVVLHVNNSHATASFTAAQPEVRQALENALPKLREMLGEAGIQLGQASVGAGTPNHQQSGFGGRPSPGRGGSGDGADDGLAPIRTVRTEAITGGNGLVDTFA